MELPEIPWTAGERATLEGYLDYHRAVFARKASGLDATGLAHRCAPSTLTLGGLVSHLAFVEDYWATWIFGGDQPSMPWREMDWEKDSDADYHFAEGREVDELLGLWTQSVAQARRRYEGSSLDACAARPRGGQDVTLRWILLHMIEEYARHNGHADLLREAVDGSVGD